VIPVTWGVSRLPASGMLGSAPPPTGKTGISGPKLIVSSLISNGDRPVRARVQHPHEYARSECAEDGFESKTRGAQRYAGGE